MDKLTLEEAKAIINAQNNLLNEIRARWLAQMELHQIEMRDDDRQVNMAWLSLGAKPFSQNFFDKSLLVFQGKYCLYPEPVDADALKSALIKMNGPEWVKK